MSSSDNGQENNQNAVNAEENEEVKEITNDDDASISFIEQVETALTTAKSKNKILIVLCESAQTIEYIDIWNHAKVVEAVEKHAVCLLIRDDTLAYKQFTALYPVVAFPTMYCINPQNGQVLQCKYKEQITLHSVVESITTSMQLIEQQADDAKRRSELQIREITALNGPQNNNPNPIISIQEMDQRSQDSLISSSPQNECDSATKKKASVLTKLEQIREKARSQKIKSSSNTSTKSTEKKSSNIATPKAKQKKTAPSESNNYNFEGEKLDPIAYMEVTRRNKLRKRKKKVEEKQSIKPKEVVKDTEDDAVASTPIMSAVKKGTWNMNKKKARLAFRINNEMDIEKYFNYDATLMDVMMYIINETGVNDFVFVSQYPPINMDSMYLDRRMSAEMGLFTKHHDEKSNESMYDEKSNELQKTLYELNMVPSCRVFIQPKFKGHKRADTDWSDNIFLKCGNFIMDLLKIIVHYGYTGLWFVLCFIWEIINVPLSKLGITQSSDNTRSSGTGNAKRNRNSRPPSRKSKLPPYKKDKRLQGRKSGMGRLRHLENEEDQNKLNNGNSTMYGGDGNQ